MKQGFKQARKADFRYAITVDSDGQHYADDLPHFVQAIASNPDAFIIGSRSFDNKNMPGKSKFANKFSNFWFRLQTAKNIADTQTGYRLYPIRRMNKMLPLTNRYEAELELLVRSAWRGIKLLPIPIKVFYPKKEERISHFRPSKDFTRISLLNTVLCLLAIIYGYPAMLIHKLIGR